MYYKIKSVDELERKYRENLQIKGLQGVNFSCNVVVGGEEKASRVYWVDKWSTDNCFLNCCIVPVEIRRGFNVVVPSEWSERYLEKELCVDGEMQVFKLDRGYKELIERVGWKKTNYMKYLPYNEADIAVGEEDNGNNDFITYLVVTNYTGGDRTITNRDRLYDELIGNNPINDDGFVKYKNLNKCYINDVNIMYLIKNKLYRPKIRLLFDDGG